MNTATEDLIAALIFLGIYFVPAIIAAALFLGWTGIGWVIAICIALWQKAPSAREREQNEP